MLMFGLKLLYEPLRSVHGRQDGAWNGLNDPRVSTHCTPLDCGGEHAFMQNMELTSELLSVQSFSFTLGTTDHGKNEKPKDMVIYN